MSFFNDYFAHWKIKLSDDAISDLRHGRILQIVKAGWTIKVLFGEDVQGPYMDFYAAHRMTNDRHLRVRCDGNVKGLPTMCGLRLCSSDPEEDERLEQEHQSANQRVITLLDEKGFGTNGQEHLSFLIQRYQLGAHPQDESETTK